MKTITLDIGNIQTVRALHIYLAYMLDFPAYYGRNLDALHDLLTEQVQASCILLTGEAASDEMRGYLPRLERVLEDSAQENNCFSWRRA